MEIVLVQYYEKLKESLKFYAEATEDKTIKSQLEFQQKLFNSNLFRDLYIMQFRFISDVFRHLERLFLAQAQSDYDDIISTRLGAFVGYILGIIIAYLVLWIPFVGNLNKQIWRTKSMLTIIPIDVIVKMPKI